MDLSDKFGLASNKNTQTKITNQFLFSSAKSLVFLSIFHRAAKLEAPPVSDGEVPLIFPIANVIVVM